MAGRVARRRARRSRDRSRATALACDRASTRSLRIEDGAYAHILVPRAAARAAARTARPRASSPISSTAPCACNARSTICSRRVSIAAARVARSAACAPRCGSARTSCSSASRRTRRWARRSASSTSAARGFVNGVLRSLARPGPPWPLPAGDDVASIGVRTSHPDWIVQHASSTSSAPTTRIATLELDNEPPPVTLRVNPMRTTVEAADGRAARAGVEVAAGHARAGRAAACATPATSRALARDRATGASRRRTRRARRRRRARSAAGRARPRRRGGARRQGDGRGRAHARRRCSWSRRPAPGRGAHRARAPPHRLGARARSSPRRRRRPPARRCATASFDRVLLDAPCSGLGVLRRRPDARWRVATARRRATSRRCSATCWPTRPRAVRPGGRLVYSVCTLTPARDARRRRVGARPSFPSFVAERAAGRAVAAARPGRAARCRPTRGPTACSCSSLHPNDPPGTCRSLRRR